MATANPEDALSEGETEEAIALALIDISNEVSKIRKNLEDED